MNSLKNRMPMACLALVALSGAAIAQTRTHSALFGDVVEYPTTGCDGAVVQTPLPGKQFAAPSSGLSSTANSFYALAAAHHVTWLSSMQCTHTGRSHALVPVPEGEEHTAISNSYVSQNWSGYQISNTAQATEAGWTIPTAARPHPGYSGTGYYSATWIGIGGGVGAGSGPLIQAGSAQEIAPLPATGNYYFWYEIVGGPTTTRDPNGHASEVKILPGSCADCLTANPGDAAGSVAIWTPNVGTPTLGTVNLGVCNFTLGKCVSFTIGGPNDLSLRPPTPQPGNTTEWIVEAPSNGPTVLPLTDFDHVDFVNACWAATYVGSTGTCSTIAQGSFPGTLFLQRYVFGVNQIIAAPDALNSDDVSFTDFYFQPIKDSGN